MATVPKVLFREQKYTCIFLLKSRHQSLTKDMYSTKTATPECYEASEHLSMPSLLPNSELNHWEEKHQSTKPFPSFQHLLHWFKTLGVAEGRSLLKWRIPWPTNKFWLVESLQLGPAPQHCGWLMENIWVTSPSIQVHSHPIFHDENS